MRNIIKKILRESEFDWLPDQSEIGLEVRVNGKPFHVKKPTHRQDEGVFKRKVNGWSNCYEIVGEEIFTGIDCYIVKLNESYPEVYFPKKYFTEQDFCGLMNESVEEKSDCVGINLSNLTVEEKIKVLEKLELIYKTFIGFSQYPWVDQIQYLVTDFTTPVTMPLKGKRDQCGRWFTIAPEDAYKEETDSYEVPISMDGTKVRWSREIDGHEFLTMSFIDDTSKLFESEEDFGWVDEFNDKEPFHHILIQNDERDFGLKFNNVDRILFNPPALVGDKRFNDVVFWLEDRDYYPNNLENYGVPTSFIEITKRKHANKIRNGKYSMGPNLSEQELYKLSQENTRPDWNGNIWYEQFMKEFRIK